MKSAEPLDAASHRGLAVACARRFTGRGVAMEELISEAETALLEAASRFDPDRGARFSTYAIPFVLGALRDLCRKSAPMHVPRTDLKVLAAARCAHDALMQAGGREPGLCQIAEQIGVEPARLGQMVAAHQRMHSASGDGRIPEAWVDDFENRVLLRDALSRLPPPLPRVVRLRFVMGLSQQETARLLGVSQSCVSRWEGKARRAALDILQPG